MRIVLVLTLCLLAGCEGITVDEAAGNTPPQISGTPESSVLMADVYEFAPKASDADGDELTFAILNRPEWANFDTASGMLEGQPGPADLGVYRDIRISVSDGAAESALPAFAVTVSASADGAISLSWDAPTENSDGSPLIDLAGYVIHYGESPGSYDREIRLDNPGLTRYMVEDLLPGTYYLAATSFNSAGVESFLSEEVESRVN